MLQIIYHKKVTVTFENTFKNACKKSVNFIYCMVDAMYLAISPGQYHF